MLKGWIELLSGREVKKAVKFFDDALRYRIELECFVRKCSTTYAVIT